ncbi:hypothetical protein, partial [Acidovorax sp. Q11]
LSKPSAPANNPLYSAKPCILYRVFKHPDNKTKLFFNPLDRQQRSPKEHHHQPPNTPLNDQIIRGKCFRSEALDYSTG